MEREDIVLPEDLQDDIDELFCFNEDRTYQDRAHDYLRRYRVFRECDDTAVQCVVNDIARRAFEAGVECAEPVQAAAGNGELAAELLECAAKCTRAAMMCDVMMCDVM